MITLDLAGLFLFLSENMLTIVWLLLGVFGAVLFFWIFGWAAAQLWLIHIQHAYGHHRRFVLLAIDIPQENLQTPKAVEQIFAQLHGSISGINMKEKWWEGKTQDSYSLEIISIGGYVQFLIRSNAALRDLVEAAVYAQYPDAEITEVADYTEGSPQTFPDQTMNIWGTEFVLAKGDAYPIRTYPEFEHSAAEDIYKDSMAALLEIMAKLQPTEQVWLQFVITPASDSWQNASQKVVDLLAGKPVKKEKTFLDRVGDAPLHAISAVSDAVIPNLFGQEEEEAKRPADFVWSLMQHLTPGEKSDIEKIEDKMSKIGFRVKFRLAYLAKHSIFSKARGVAPIVGAIKQFNTINLNAFDSSKLVKTDAPVYFFVPKRIAYRQKKFMAAYRARSNHRGAGHGSILNIEELATVWHFPMNTVRAPLVKKADAKRAEPPTELPIETPEMASRMQDLREKAMNETL